MFVVIFGHSSKEWAKEWAKEWTKE